MAVSDLCPTEDAVHVLLDYLVDPMLPARSSLWHTPSQSHEQSVAKQVHAVVLLYSSYHRKKHPHLEHLGFEPFCMLAVVLKPTLLAHMKFMQRSNDAELDDLGKQLSLMEKAVMDACDICVSLDASKDVPSTEGCPVSKVTIFLVDSKKENCYLQFSSITQGVWSLIEKDIDVPDYSSEGTLEGKHISEKKRVNRKSLRDELSVNEVSFQQLAFSAVKEETGINRSDLIIMESHVVYSLNKEKTVARFYIMQCTLPNSDDLIQISIRDVIDSLQGPLLCKSSYMWTVTPVVKYFHLLLYAGIVSDWLSRCTLSLAHRRQSYLQAQNDDICKNVVNEVQAANLNNRMNLCMEGDLNDTTSCAKFKVKIADSRMMPYIAECRGKEVENGKAVYDGIGSGWCAYW